MLTIGSLFAGIGGFDLGFERAGMETAWTCEIDPWCRHILRRHFPKAEVYNDVKKLRGDALEPVDVICFGWPCQDLSVAGLRKGLAGKRSGLFGEAIRIISEVKPRWIVAENVPGLLSSHRGRDMGTVAFSLGQLGYWWAMRRLDAQYFGLAQRRKRQIFVGNLGDPAGAAEVLFEPESLRRDSAPRRREGEEVAEILGKSPEVHGSTGQNVIQIVPVVAGTLGSRSGGGYRTTDIDTNGAFVAESCCVSEIRNGRGVPSTIAAPLKAQSGTSDATKAVCFPAEMSGTHVASAEDICIALSIKHTAAIAFGGGNTSGPIQIATVVNAHGSGRYDFESETFCVEGYHVRRLTPTECCRLQGFPDDWNAWGLDEAGNRVEISDTQRYKQIGNAVAVPVAEWAGRRLGRHEMKGDENERN